jgi:aspartyl-tRNA(Asn)/glutamyl-tRNA(Gln) amidotransferase subunit B
LDLEQISGSGRLRDEAEKVIRDHREAAEKYLAGEKKVLGFFIGRIMESTRGRADPKGARKALEEVFAEMKDNNDSGVNEKGEDVD